MQPAWKHLTGGAVIAAVLLIPAPAAEAPLTRPGQLTVSAITGELGVRSGEALRPAKVDERVRVDSRLVTARRSLATLAFSNGASLELGPESEVELEELLQAPFTTALKPSEWKAEPSVSRTRLRVIRGEVRVTLKRLLSARGSSFLIVTPAGTASVDEGALRAQVRMTEIGIGLCSVELVQGAATFQTEEGAARALEAGRRTQWSVETDAAARRTRVTELK